MKRIRMTLTELQDLYPSPQVDALSQAPEKKEERPYRKGMSYKRMKADKSVCHDSDFSRLPKDAVIIKTFYKYSYQ